MDTQPIYVPVLKGKEGEFAALEELKPKHKPLMMPLIEIPDVPYDYVNERPAKTIDEHIFGIAERLQRCWRDGPLYLDLPWFDEQDRLQDGRIAFEAVLGDCVKREVKAVPVVSLTSSPGHVTAAARYLTKTGSSAGVRLRVEDFEADIDLEEKVDQLLSPLSDINRASLDLMLDMEDLGPETNRGILVARSLFSMIPHKDAWRRIILAATSFPEDLSDVGAETTTTLPRREWELWKTLQRRPKNLPRPDLIFGDYAIAHPTPKELDPRTMRMSANIRYTTPDNWLIVKGRNVRQYGFDQYFALCKELINRPEYCGRQFSWGDKYIEDCANEMTGPGNATTWRKVGTNHHLTLVLQELSKLSPGA